MELVLMEALLRVEAEAKYFLGMTDRAYEQSLLDELSKILEEVELLFGPRDRSYRLLPPRICEGGFAHPLPLPFKKIRIYLPACCKNRYVASHMLAHEAVHVLDTGWRRATVLEEGLAEWFAIGYSQSEYGLQFKPSNRWYDAAFRAVAPLMAKNKFVIKELRAHQPQISKIDEKLLVEVAGIELDQAKVLCAAFDRGWREPETLSEYTVVGARLLFNGVRSVWDEWKSR